MTDWLTTREAAALLGLAPKTLRTYYERGRAVGKVVVPTEFAGRLLWPRHELIGWIRQVYRRGYRRMSHEQLIEEAHSVRIRPADSLREQVRGQELRAALVARQEELTGAVESIEERLVLA